MTMRIRELSTIDPEVAHATLNELFASDRPMRFSGDPRDFVCDLRSLTTPDGLGVDRIRHSMDVRCVMHPVETFMTVTVMNGAYDRFDTRDEQIRVRRGEVARYPTDAGLTAAWRSVDSAVLRVPLSEIVRAAHHRIGRPVNDVRFFGMTPVSTARARAWRQLTVFAHTQLTVPEPTLESPLVSAQLRGLIAATALETFENTCTRMLEQPRPPLPPATIRRAMAFIEANPHRPLTVVDIAEAMGVTARALQYGFARHCDTTPVTFLREVRLGHAHRDLQAAHRDSGATVTQIARRWGFANPSRFAGHYRTKYDRSPSETLRDG